MVALTSAVMVYVLPGLLGRAFDMKNESVGPDLFKYDAVEKHKMRIPKYTATTEYKVVSDLTEATDFLDVNGKLTLKVKAVSLSAEGSGAYLKDTQNLDNKIDLLIKAKYETVVDVLTNKISPIPQWQEMVKNTDFTHYVRAVQYGGELIASVRFTVLNKKDKQDIKATVEGSLSAKSGSFSGSIKGSLKKLQSELSGKTMMDINYYATVPLKTVASDIDSLVSLVSDFPKQTEEVGGGLGVPMSMEVISLAALDKELKPTYQTTAFKDQLTLLNEQFSDIRNAKQRLSDFLKTIPPILPPSENAKIGKFSSHLENLNNIFTRVIANLDQSEEAKAEQFNPAFDAYKDGKEYTIPGKYVREMSKLRKDVLDNTEAIQDDFGGSQYLHWGSDECPDHTKEVYSGVMSATEVNLMGSMDWLCMPNDKLFYKIEEEHIDQDEIGSYPKVSPVFFKSQKSGGTSNPKKIKCSRCRVPGKTTTTTLIGVMECPENWQPLYSGVVASGSGEKILSKAVCLDTSKTFHDADEKGEETENTAVLTEVSPDCSRFPCKEDFGKKSAVACVVCTRKKMDVAKSDEMASNALNF